MTLGIVYDLIFVVILLAAGGAWFPAPSAWWAPGPA